MKKFVTAERCRLIINSKSYTKKKRNRGYAWASADLFVGWLFCVSAGMRSRYSAWNSFWRRVKKQRAATAAGKQDVRQMCKVYAETSVTIANYSAPSRHVRFIFTLHCKNDLVTRDQRHVIPMFTSFSARFSLSNTPNFFSEEVARAAALAASCTNRRFVLISSVRRKENIIIDSSDESFSRV